MSDEKKVCIVSPKKGGKSIQAHQKMVDYCLANNVGKIEVVTAGDSIKAMECYDLLKRIKNHNSYWWQELGEELTDEIENVVEKFKD